MKDFAEELLVNDARWLVDWSRRTKKLSNTDDLIVAYACERVAMTIVNQAEAGSSILSKGDLRTLAEIERDHIKSILNQTGTMEEAAEILGINLSTLWRKRKLYRFG
jgi:NtrC-family two-component system response regulator AlgB